MASVRRIRFQRDDADRRSEGAILNTFTKPATRRDETVN
ncbi:MAG: hypothetical protein JWM72_2666, partial [Actinomycetia bacterium]|nr:hypothetical protein [Actinomycetes bacterium]